MIAAAEFLSGPPFAHRGLWTPEGAPQNTLAAFDAACDAGYGVELDVRLSADGEAVVFHDESLDELTDCTGPVAARTAAELAEVRVLGSHEKIPTLAEALALIGRRARVLIEHKTWVHHEGPLERRVAEVLDDHPGSAAVLGFNPWVLAWWAGERPERLRGLNASDHVNPDAQVTDATRVRPIPPPEHVAAARPHFVSLGKELAPFERAGELALPVVAWTVRSPEQRDRVAAADNYMFEGFTP